MFVIVTKTVSAPGSLATWVASVAPAMSTPSSRHCREIVDAGLPVTVSPAVNASPTRPNDGLTPSEVICGAASGGAEIGALSALADPSLFVAVTRSEISRAGVGGLHRVGGPGRPRDLDAIVQPLSRQ